MNEIQNYHFNVAVIKLLMHQKEPAVQLKKHKYELTRNRRQGRTSAESVREQSVEGDVWV